MKVHQSLRKINPIYLPWKTPKWVTEINSTHLKNLEIFRETISCALLYVQSKDIWMWGMFIWNDICKRLDDTRKWHKEVLHVGGLRTRPRGAPSSENYANPKFFFLAYFSAFVVKEKITLLDIHLGVWKMAPWLFLKKKVLSQLRIIGSDFEHLLRLKNSEEIFIPFRKKNIGILSTFSKTIN